MTIGIQSMIFDFIHNLNDKGYTLDKILSTLKHAQECYDKTIDVRMPKNNNILQSKDHVLSLDKQLQYAI